MPDGFHNWCRSCLYSALNRSYLGRRHVVEDAKKQPCLDCARTFPTWVMQFDHLRDKTFKLGNVQRGLQNIRREIDKCEVVCANCHRVRSKARKDALPRQQTKVQETWAQRVAFRAWQVWLAEQKTGPCLDCGETFHSASMDFDHVRGMKVANIAKMWFRPREIVLAEIAKCDLVCANCHAHRTYCRGRNIPHYVLNGT